MDRWRGCEGEMLCYQEATYKIIRHWSGPRPPPCSSANRCRVHLNRNPSCIVNSLFFFHCGRSVTALNTSVPQAVPTSGIGIWIFLVGAVVRGIPLLPLLSLIPPSMFVVLSSLSTNPFYGCTRVLFTRALIYLCTRIGHFHSRSFLIASCIFREVGEEVAKKCREILPEALDSWGFSRIVHLWKSEKSW